jgi:hypothetical protein
MERSFSYGRQIKFGKVVNEDEGSLKGSVPESGHILLVVSDESHNPHYDQVPHVVSHRVSDVASVHLGRHRMLDCDLTAT